MQRPLRHQATSGFWKAYDQLPAEICRLADQCFELLKQNPRHPSLHFKKVGRYCGRFASGFITVPQVSVRKKGLHGSGLGLMPSMTNFFPDLQHTYPAKLQERGI